MDASLPSRHLSTDDAEKVRSMVELPPLEVERLIREVAGIWKNVSPLDRPYYEASGKPEFMGDRLSGLRAHVLDRAAAIAVSSLREGTENVLFDAAQRFFERIELACGVRLSVKVLAFCQDVHLPALMRADWAKQGVTVANARDDQELRELSADQVANLYVRRTCAHANAVLAKFERLSSNRGDESSGILG